MSTKAKLNPVLQIDPEFESKIPPLTEDEYTQLEENIISEGAVLMPLIVWNDTIVDGHNRYKIAQAHPGIIFDTLEKDFDNRYEALSWICKNQLGRRNLTPEQKDYLIGHRYKAEKEVAAFHGNQHTSPSESGGVQNEHHHKSGKARQRVAQETGTTESYVMRAEWYADGVDAAEQESPGAKGKLLTGKVKAKKKDVAAIARASPEERKSLMDQIFCPQKVKPDKAELAAIQQISDDMAKDKPGMTPQKAVQQFEWKVTSTLQDFDSFLDEWPQFLSDEKCRRQVVATLQDLKQYILHIEGGTRYEWDYESRKIV